MYIKYICIYNATYEHMYINNNCVIYSYIYICNIHEIINLIKNYNTS